MTGGLSGRQATFRLPVKLSAKARREVLLETGNAPDEFQLFEIDDLTALDRSDRVELLDIVDQVNIEAKDLFADFPDAPLKVVYRVEGWGVLKRDETDRSWAVYGAAPGVYRDLDKTFLAGDGHTLQFADWYRLRELHPDRHVEFDALLDGAPLVLTLGSPPQLTLTKVFEAYRAAMGLAKDVAAIVQAGFYPQDPFGEIERFERTDDALFLHPQSGPERRDLPTSICFLRVASRDVHWRDTVGRLQELADRAPTAVFDEAVHKMVEFAASSAAQELPDYQRLALSVDRVVGETLTQVEANRAKKDADAVYSAARTSWISRYGTSRLKRASERGYRHDGIYREERAAAELPGFTTSLGRRPKIGDVMNPSADALNREDEAVELAEGLGLPARNVKLVFAQPDHDSDWTEGEYVQVTGWLGRHTVWLPVSSRRIGDDDIPF